MKLIWQKTPSRWIKLKIILTTLFFSTFTSHPQLTSLLPKKQQSEKQLYFHQIKLGSQKKRNEIPSYFSTQTGKTYFENEICLENGKLIDIAFEGILPYHFRFTTPNLCNIPGSPTTRWMTIPSIEDWLNDNIPSQKNLSPYASVPQLQTPSLFYFTVSTQSQGYLLITEANEDFIVANIKILPEPNRNSKN